MTTGRFCAQCGQEAGGGAFCQHCGAAQHVGDATAATAATATPRNEFCPNCGTKAEPGLAFCTQCGTNLATGVAPAHAQHVHQDAQSKTPIYVGVGAVVVALIIAVVVMSGGGDDSSSSVSSSSSSAPSATTGTNPATPSASATQKPVEDKTVASLPKLRSAPPQIDPAARLGEPDMRRPRASPPR